MDSQVPYQARLQVRKKLPDGDLAALLEVAVTEKLERIFGARQKWSGSAHQK